MNFEKGHSEHNKLLPSFFAVIVMKKKKTYINDEDTLFRCLVF